MIKTLRRSSVRTRLIALVVIQLLAAGIIAGLALSGFSALRSSLATASSDSRVERTALEAKFQAADWNGWQTAYAFDALRGVKDAASDSGASRSAFLKSGRVLSAKLSSLDKAAGLTTKQRASVNAAIQAVAAFELADQAVVKGYAARTPTGFKAANDLVIGAEIVNYTKVANAVDALATSVATRADHDKTAAIAASNSAKTLIEVSFVVAMVLVLGVVTVVIASIVRPLAALRGRLTDITEGEGDLRARLDEEGGDEIAGISVLFNRFVGQLADIIRGTAEQAGSVASATYELSATTDTIAASAEEAATQAQVVSAAAEQVSSSVQIVSAGSDEMDISIREIARSASQATRVAADAVAVTTATTHAIARLGDSSAEIGNVVRSITAIAEQTNLLALNATIEAARAGEAGRGFAVVAGEVKELAEETARATEDIHARVQSIQTDTADAVTAIAQISQVIESIHGLQSTIGAAVEEQTATTNEMSRNVGEAASGSTGIALNIVGVAEASQLTAQSVTQSMTAIAELSRMSSDLLEMVSRFKY